MGNAPEVAAPDADPAPPVRATIGEAAGAHGAADGLFAHAGLPGGGARVEFGIEPRSGGRDQLCH